MIGYQPGKDKGLTAAWELILENLAKRGIILGDVK